MKDSSRSLAKLIIPILFGILLLYFWIYDLSNPLPSIGNSTTYECDVIHHESGISIEISSPGALFHNNKIYEIQISSDSTTHENLLHLYDLDDNELLYAHESVNFPFYSNFSISQDKKLEYDIHGILTSSFSYFEIFDSFENEIAYAKFYEDQPEKQIFDMNHTLIADYHFYDESENYTVRIIPNETLTNESILLIMASYYFYHYHYIS